MYQRIVPSYLPKPKHLVQISGVMEILLGISLFFSETKNTAIYLIILMLIAFLPIHFYMLSNKKASMGLPNWVLITRIPLQFALMYWAYIYIKL